MSRPAPFAALVLVLSTLPAGAQSQIATFPGAAPGDHHSVVLGGADLDGDGFDDLVVGAPDDDTAGTGAGAVYAYSGLTEALLWVQYGNAPIAAFGHALALSFDLDGDTVEDIVVGAPFAQLSQNSYPGHVRVLSGADGSVLFTGWGDDHNEGMGWSVAGSFEWIALERNFAGGAPFDDDSALGGVAANAGSIRVWSAKDGSLKATVYGDAPGDLFGWSMCNAGSIDPFNTNNDLAVGAPGADGVHGDVGMVRVYGLLGEWWTQTGLASGDQMGWALAPAGDLDLDNVDDILVGEPGNGDNGPLAGRVRALSGTNGPDLGVWRGDGPGDRFGSSLALLGRLDANPYFDWAAGAPQTGTGTGYVRAFSNFGSELFTLFGDAPGDEFGSSVSDAGLPRGGLNAITPAIAVGAASFDGPGGSETGMARLYFAACPGFVDYCTAGISASGCQATLVPSGLPSASAPSGFTLSSTNVEGAKDGVFYFGWNGRQAAPWGNGSSYQCVVPPVKRGGVIPKQGSHGACDGSFSQDLNQLWSSSPAKNPGAGAVVQAQLWYRDPKNTSNRTTSLSDAVEFTVCP